MKILPLVFVSICLAGAALPQPVSGDVITHRTDGVSGSVVIKGKSARWITEGRAVDLGDGWVSASQHSGHERVVANLPGGRILVAGALDVGLAGTVQALAEVSPRGGVETHHLYFVPSRGRKADPHAQPQVWVDSTGRVCFLIGAHNGPLYMSRAQRPGRVDEGLRVFRRVGVPAQKPQWGYTYPSVQEIGGSLHVVARKTGAAGRGYRFDLVHTQSDDWGETWTEEVISGLPSPHVYGIYYHKALIEKIEGGSRLVVTARPHLRVTRGAELRALKPVRLVRVFSDGWSGQNNQ